MVAVAVLAAAAHPGDGKNMMTRILRHLLTEQWAVRRQFPAAVLTSIEQAIQQSEMRHGGEVCFVVEAALSTSALLKNQSARERALEVFSQLHIWDTEHNNGVLIYLLLADRDVEIIADRGIHNQVNPTEWENICRTMEASFQQQQFATGITDGIERITTLLQRHFPARPDEKNAVADRPVIL